METLLAPQLIGRDPMPIESIWADLYAAMRDRGHRTGFYIDAMAGVDSALWDLRGKRAGLPVYALLGGPCQPGGRVPAYCGVSGALPRRCPGRWRSAPARASAALKVHVRGLRGRARRADARRAAAGPGRGAVHGRAQHAARGRGPAAGTRPGAARLPLPGGPHRPRGRRRAAGPDRRARPAHRLRRGGAHPLAVPRPAAPPGWWTWCSRTWATPGISELRRIAQLAEAHHVACAPHLSAGLGVCIAAAVHAAAAMPNLYRLEHSPASFARGNPCSGARSSCATAPTSCPRGRAWARRWSRRRSSPTACAPGAERGHRHSRDPGTPGHRTARATGSAARSDGERDGNADHQAGVVRRGPAVRGAHPARHGRLLPLPACAR